LQKSDVVFKVTQVYNNRGVYLCNATLVTEICYLYSTV